MTNKRFELLHKIVAASSSTELERAAALKELDSDGQVSPDTQDAELERYWSQRESGSSLMPERSQLSSATQEVLTDIGHFLLGIPPLQGAGDRLTKLLDKTNSDVVRQKISPALRSINFLIESGRIKYASNT